MLDKVTDGAAQRCLTRSPRVARRTDQASVPSPKMVRAALNLTSDLVLFFEPEVLRFVDANEAACAALA